MRKECPNRKINEKDCPCLETDCENHGICCQCIRHHKECGDQPACLR